MSNDSEIENECPYCNGRTCLQCENTGYILDSKWMAYQEWVDSKFDEMKEEQLLIH